MSTVSTPDAFALRGLVRSVPWRRAAPRWAGVAALALLGWAGSAQALGVSSFSPQGEVAKLEQVVVKFDAPAVRAGDARAPAPYVLQCSDAQAAQGQGRWNNAREWVFDFRTTLPPGVQCTAQPVAGFAPPVGTPWQQPKSYRFSSGGPLVQNIEPGTYQEIEEEQYFVLQLNGDATPESLRAHVSCQPGDVGERMPVRLIEGDERQVLLKANRLDKQAARTPQRFATLACQRRLSPGSEMTLVFGPGVATPSGVANREPQRFTYRVRAPFTATFSCERANAQSACLPIVPLRLHFNAPVPRKLAQAVRLKSEQVSLEPRLPDAAQEDAMVHGLEFPAPLPVRSSYQLVLPDGFQDDAGRTLANASSFPMAVATGDMPPLAKFAAAPFGIVERFAEGPPATQPPTLLPVTLRKVEADLPLQSLPVGTLQPRSDAEIIAWQRKLARYEAFTLERKQVRRDVSGPLPAALPDDPDASAVQTRMVSLLAGQGGVKKLELPRASSNDPRPFEVVGIPLPVGFHVVEIASPLLGQVLLDARHGSARTMYVRTSALVTNLAVHFKLGRENASAWVTTLDKGQSVANAQVQVSDCNGRVLAQARTDGQGLAQLEGLSPQPPACEGEGEWRSAYFISARAENEGVQDMAFTWSDWQRGIEPWRFNLPTNQMAEADGVAHTVLDRSLLRAGETLSMKHFVRSQTSQGLGLPERWPERLVITHVGSGQEFSQPLAWRKTPTGGRSSTSQWQVPPAAKLGVYQLALHSGEQVLESGSFRVEEFRLPVLQGRIAPVDSKPLVRVRQLPTEVQVQYVSGGAAARLPVRVSALVRSKAVLYPDWDEFHFDPPRPQGAQTSSSSDSDDEEASASQDSRVVADKLALTLDPQGAGRVTLENLPTQRTPQELLLEASFADPNGEVQTLRSTHTLWPAAVVVGIKAEGWASSGARARFQVLALGLNGKPLAGVPLAVQAIARATTTTRKRMVGGFYSYDNTTQTKDLGTVCTGQSDGRGLLLCEARLDEPGEVELVATARDKDGNEAQAGASVWVTRQGELWFGGEDHDRIDLLPEKKSYQPGETAVFQVRMPFRYATALVSVEREGILEQQVVTLQGQDPTLRLPVREGWGPNVYVSVLALRGRLRDVPWYSFFTWGYKAPREWWTAFWFEGREYIAPTALVDLSKPAYRLGVAEIRVTSQAHHIDVQVRADKDSYPVRGKAQVTIEAKLPDGRPAAGADVALAVVDQALLELMPNRSWDLLGAMLQRRSWGVETSTAQMEIIGRRHYGKKAVPAGGGGGRAPTRELLDTLVLWQPNVRLDAQGRAQVSVPLNDALTSFQVVAVADMGVARFGTGQAQIRTTQDLQIISGLPPLVREGDRLRAQLTLRNTTKAAMKVEVSARAAPLDLPARSVEIAPGEAQEVAWDVSVPQPTAAHSTPALRWEVQARDTLSGARDALAFSQRVVPAVPLTVQQATLVQLAPSLSLPVAVPQGAEAGRGGLKMTLVPKLADGLPGVRDWWARYPYICLEQKASKAMGLGDVAQWQQVAAQLPTYLDSDGLASYFPPRDGETQRGSDTLSAYLLAATHEAAQRNPAFALPEEARNALLRGLQAFVLGRIERTAWSPRQDLELRKLAAIAALARYGQAQAHMLTSLNITPQQWPTHALIDWLQVLQRVQDLPQRQQRQQEVLQLLQSRLHYSGTQLGFGAEDDQPWWWLMHNSDTNAARLLLAVQDEASWQAELPRLVSGLLARQRGGAWQTTTANLWGALALERVAAKLEAVPVTGTTRASLGAQQAVLDWRKVQRVAPGGATATASSPGFGASPLVGMWQGNTLFLPWSAEPANLQVTHQGTGKPWLTLQSLAAVPLAAPVQAGYSVEKTVTPIEQANPQLPAGQYTRGDVLRVTLLVTARSDMGWVAITDPIPAGATILGSGLGRDSDIATLGERRTGTGWPTFEERSFEAMRGYYEYLPKGTVKLQYTVRLNNAGRFQLPPTRVEALYAPEVYGELPNTVVQVVQP